MPSNFAPKWLCAAVVAVAGSFAMASSAFAAFPDIQQANPLGDGVGPLAITQNGSSAVLAFPSDIFVGNNGGSLQISGSRKDTSVLTMDAFQTGVSGPVGALQFSVAYGHDHWHYLALDRYDLLPQSPSVATQGLAASLGRDTKSGFCLVQSPQPNNSSDCLKGQTNALDLTGANAETIGANHHDIYEPTVDGQFIDVSGLLPARGQSAEYELVQWVNADCRLSDMGPNNHTWAVVVKLSTDNNGNTTVAATNDHVYWYDYYNSLSTAQKCLPKETVRPQISGSAMTGAVVSAVPGSWLLRMGSAVPKPFLYNWMRCDNTGWACSLIPGATSANYVPTGDDVGHTLRARVTGQFLGTTEQNTPEDSSPTAVVAVGPSSSIPAPGSTLPDDLTSKVASLTAALKASKRISVHNLLRRGLHSRAHCSMACKVRIDLVGPGAIELGHVTASFKRSGSRTLVVKLSRRGRRVVRRYHGGKLTAWLYVKSHDGQQQTLSRVLNLKV
jgi:hypothetical protein